MEKLPNILMIMTDQQRYDSLGCYGFTQGHTPHLDRLAEEGLVYEHCYVNNTICSPSRASIMTGKPLPGHGVFQLHDMMPEDEVFFPKRLQDKGYYTALFGKLHAGAREYEACNRHPNDGFNTYENALSPSTGLNREDALNGSYVHWLKENAPEFYEQFAQLGRRMKHIPENLHYSHWAAERTISFLEQHEVQKAPFFCCMSLFDPHDPYNDYPLSILESFESANLPERTVGQSPPASRIEAVMREREHHYLGSFDDFSEEEIGQIRLGYHASVAFLDQQIGRVLDVLDQQGLAENTIVVFLSDHGDMLGDHELLAKGAFFHDPCTRVPLIIRSPGGLRVGRNERLVQPHDVAATLLIQAGYSQKELDRYMPDSMDLLSADAGRDYAICMYRNSGVSDNKLYYDPPIHATMYRESRYKMNVIHNLSEFDSSHQGELYDMLEDPLEQNNLWNDEGHQPVRFRLLLQLMDRMVGMDVKYNGSRGGEWFPDQSQWSLNNAL